MYGHNIKKKKSMKEDLDPSSATLHVITTSINCKDKIKNKKSFETMKFPIGQILQFSSVLDIYVYVYDLYVYIYDTHTILVTH